LICEICGKETDKLRKVYIEGVLLEVCEECAKLGKIIPEIKKKTEIRKSKEEKEELVLKPRWYVAVRRCLEKELKKGLKMKDIASKWGIKETLLRKISRGDIEIDIPTAKKLEKIVGESLVMTIEEKGEISNIKKGEENEHKRTLGDMVIIKIKRKK